MPEIVPLKPMDLRQAWPDEAQDFTPWLAKHLGLLSSSLSLDLRLVGTEVNLAGAGRVDILAEQAGTEAKVVIENQLEESDHSHCLRLLGYAANADANILIWIARGFTDYHRSILAWLNATDNIAVYAVALRAYRAGKIITSNFDLVVEPQSQPTASVTTKANANTRYADFYRPIRMQLGQAGLNPVGRGGFRGSWRSFQSGYPDVVYAARLTEDEAWVFLALYGADEKRIYKSLIRYRSEIDTGLGNSVEWQREKDTWSSIRLRKAMTDDDPGNPEAIQQWIVKSLVRLRDTLQPVLDEVMGVAKDSDSD